MAKEPQAGKKKKRSRFKRQKVMEKVLLALLPAFLGAIYFFGWRVAAMLACVLLVGCAAEYVMARRRGDPLTGAALVTCALYALSLPPRLPFWMAAVGIVVGIVFGKEVFGGFGRNVFNPAIVGRAFVYVCFPIEMTSQFVPVWRNGPGGFAHWSSRTLIEGTNAVTAATPMWFRRDYGFGAGLPWGTQIKQLFLVNIGGIYERLEVTSRILADRSAETPTRLL